MLTIAVLTLAAASRTYRAYLERTSSRRSAEAFSRDLSLARSSAVQRRTKVVVAFDEAQRRYVVRTDGGRELIRRRYDDDADLTLTQLDLQMPGDSLVFDGRGVADLSGIAGSLGTAVFGAGSSAHTVSFNGMGASRVSGS